MSLQVFYRIHVTTIKHLLKNEKKILERAKNVGNDSNEQTKNTEVAVMKDVNKEKESEGEQLESEKEETRNISKMEGDSETTADKEQRTDAVMGETVQDKVEAVGEEDDKDAGSTEVSDADKTKQDTNMEASGSVSHEDDECFLDVFWNYVDESFATPFALSREKDKPKVKVAERWAWGIIEDYGRSHVML